MKCLLAMFMGSCFLAISSVAFASAKEPQKLYVQSEVKADAVAQPKAIISSGDAIEACVKEYVGSFFEISELDLVWLIDETAPYKMSCDSLHYVRSLEFQTNEPAGRGKLLQRIL